MDDDRECEMTGAFRDTHARAHLIPKCPELKTMADCFCYIESWSPKWDYETLRSDNASFLEKNKLCRELIDRVEKPKAGEYADRYALEVSGLVDRIRMTSGYCARSTVNKVYYREPESLFVVPTVRLAAAVAEMTLNVSDRHMYFSLLRFANNEVKVYAKYNRIIGSRLLAWITVEEKDWAPPLLDDLFSAPSDYHPTE